MNHIETIINKSNFMRVRYLSQKEKITTDFTDFYGLTPIVKLILVYVEIRINLC